VFRRFDKTVNLVAYSVVCLPVLLRVRCLGFVVGPTASTKVFPYIVVKPGWVAATNSDNLRSNSFITKREKLISKVFSKLTYIGIKTGAPVKRGYNVSKFREITRRILPYLALETRLGILVEQETAVNWTMVSCRLV